MSVASAADYKVVCSEGRWDGNAIESVTANEKLNKFNDGMYLDEQTIYFSLPAQMGDPVKLSYNGREYPGVVTYFYDHTKYVAEQSYIKFISQPFSLQELHVVQIDSGWTHFTYTKSTEGADGNVLVTTTLSKKCKLDLINY